MTARGLSRDEVAQIYRKYGCFMHRRARLVTRDDALAEDAVHEALVKLLQNGQALREAEQPLSWLLRVVERASIDQLRRGKHLHRAAPIDETVNQMAAHPSVDLEARNSVLRVLGTLADEDQRIAMLAFVDGLSQGQIAERVGYSRVTINKRLQSIREHARRATSEVSA